MPLGLTLALGGVADGEGCLNRLCFDVELGAAFLTGGAAFLAGEAEDLGDRS